MRIKFLLQSFVFFSDIIFLHKKKQQICGDTIGLTQSAAHCFYWQNTTKAENM